ncbi:MAG: aldehyde ferredoxin oxidoreductase family protein [Deltaproteobacteria bacterium]|nr:aldehyde ferredoxin oxidoreductase family protein [Deltaproteobacteria bacterium]
MSYGYMGKILKIDLTTGKHETEDTISGDRAKYLGGKGLATRILYDMTKPGLDPYDPAMPLIFSTGPVTGTGVPQSNRFVVTTRSPLTGAIANSTSGGDLATKFKKAGYDILIVTGRAKHPVLIEIREDKVEIKAAKGLWGKGTIETQDGLPKDCGHAVIGPAGENKVRFACIVSGHRVAGRTGIGAVMGSKNLKAVSATGNKKVEIMNESDLREFHKFMVKFLKDHPMTGDILPRLGTANLVQITAGRNIIPTRNFQTGHDEKTLELSGEEMAAHHLERQSGCLACPIRCGREVKYEGKVIKGPEFETIGLMGNNLGVFSLPAVFNLSHLCDDLGVDSISCGNSIGFAAELNQRGLWKNGVEFGDTGRIVALMREIAHREGIGDDIADGTKRMAEKHGGKEFAINAKGLELPAYDPRGCWGQGLEYATTPRGGCHINGSTMYLEATGPVTINPHSIKAKPPLVVMQQNTAAAISSSIFCQFTAYAMIPKQAFSMDPNGALYKAITTALLNSGAVLKMAVKGHMPLQVLWFEKYLSMIFGRKVTMGDFNEYGARAFQMEKLYNCREGFSRKDDTLPERMLRESTFKDVSTSGVPLDEMLDDYYAIRGYDENGVITQKELDRLGIRA